MGALLTVAAVFALGGLMALVQVLRGFRRRRRSEPVVLWQPAPEPESDTYAAEKLRELGLSHLVDKPDERRWRW